MSADRTPQWRWVMLGLLVAMLPACGSEGTLTIGGCAVVQETPSGGWRGNPYELHPFLSAVRNTQYDRRACPVSILRAREPIEAEGVIWSKHVFNPSTGAVTDTERAFLRIYNAAGATVGHDEQPFFASRNNIDFKEVGLLTRYPAISGHGSFSEKDRMEVRISDYCCALPQLRGEVELQIHYQQDQASGRVTAVGDEIPERNTTASYGALSPSAGRPHTYRWYRDGAYVGTGSTVAIAVGTADFNLRVDMMDQYGRTATNTLYVDVDGVRGQIDGPDLVYVWTSPADTMPTWRVVPRGGTPPFTYTWYRSGWWTGNGESHSEHIDERGDFELRVEIRDAAGAGYNATKWIRVAERACTSSGCVSY